MDVEKELKRKKIISSLFFTLLISLSVIIILIGIYDNRSGRLKKKEALLTSKYGSTQVALLREIFYDKNLSPAEYEKRVNEIVDAAIEQARYKRLLKQESNVTYGNLIYDLYLASDYWEIKDDKKLSRIKVRLEKIAEEEVELDMGRNMGQVGINEARREGNRLYMERIETIEAHIDDDKKESFSMMKVSLDSIFNLKSE